MLSHSLELLQAIVIRFLPLLNAELILLKSLLEATMERSDTGILRKEGLFLTLTHIMGLLKVLPMLKMDLISSLVDQITKSITIDSMIHWKIT